MKKSLAIGIAIIFVAAVTGVAMMAVSGSYDHTKGSHSVNTRAAATKEGVSSDPNTVTISNYKFEPTKIVVKKGTKVTWLNLDKDRHNVKPDQENSGFKASPLLANADKHSVVFDNVGIYKYYCLPHPYMKASVEVIE